MKRNGKDRKGTKNMKGSVVGSPSSFGAEVEGVKKTVKKTSNKTVKRPVKRPVERPVKRPVKRPVGKRETAWS